MTEVDTQTACYIYGIVTGALDQADLDSVDTERRLTLVGHGDIAAVVEAISPDRTLGRRTELLAHSEVLNALATRGPVVPVRFGSVLADTDAVVTELLAANREHFHAVLEGLRGQAQFSLQARYLQDAVLAEVVAENPEIAALRAQTAGQPVAATYPAQVRLGELVAHAIEGKRQQDGDRIVGVLVPRSTRYTVGGGSGLDHLVEAAFLVPDDERQSFEQAAEQLAYEYRDRARLRLLGPLAPFEFTEGV